MLLFLHACKKLGKLEKFPSGETNILNSKYRFFINFSPVSSFAVVKLTD